MLKVQLKKYVGAVQMLKREGQTVEGERKPCAKETQLVLLLTEMLFAGTKKNVLPMRRCQMQL